MLLSKYFKEVKYNQRPFDQMQENEFAGKEVHQFLVDKKIYQQLTRNQMKANYAE